MQIIIPMSGFGERFRRAGYKLPKPLIEIDGKPIIAHVIDMFPGETDFVFICNQDHLDHPDYQMEETLRRYCATGKIVGIAPHKLGPIHAVQQVADLIKLDVPAVVNYCDFTCYWNWPHFKQFVQTTGCEGAIPAYKGFHPHTLGTTNYAYMRENGGWVADIQEKQPYTENRMEEFASSGTYYFDSGRTLLNALRETVEQNLNVGGEYYVSLAYKPMLQRGAAVTVYPLQHFMQWGTPDDVAEYSRWSQTFSQLLKDPVPKGLATNTTIIPMAGLGQRFAREGYLLTKPLIPVSGKPMVVQATDDIGHEGQQVFVLREDMPGADEISAMLQQTYKHVLVTSIPSLSEGQACTALSGLDALAQMSGDPEGPVTFAACDNGMLYNETTLSALVNDPHTDVIVWVARRHPNALRHPQMYGWVATDGNLVTGISVKTPLKDPANDPIITGTFTFKRAADFRQAVTNMIVRDARINGEFYIDTCINDAISAGLRCRILEVDAYISWGTPDDLRTFEYWQSCFHKWASHPYRLENDQRVPATSLPELESRYRTIEPTLPASRS